MGSSLLTVSLFFIVWMPCLITAQVATLPVVVDSTDLNMILQDGLSSLEENWTSFVMGTQPLLTQPRILELPWLAPGH